MLFLKVSRTKEPLYSYLIFIDIFIQPSRNIFRQLCIQYCKNQDLIIIQYFFSGLSPLIPPSLLYALASAQELDDLAFVDAATYFYPIWRATDKKPNCLGFVDGKIDRRGFN